jgi:hypothetical protein
MIDFHLVVFALRSPAREEVNVKITALLPKTWNKNSPEIEGLAVLQRLMNDSILAFCGFVSAGAPGASITVWFEGYVRNVTPDTLHIASEDSAPFAVGLSAAHFTIPDPREIPVDLRHSLQLEYQPCLEIWMPSATVAWFSSPVRSAVTLILAIQAEAGKGCGNTIQFRTGRRFRPGSRLP